MQYEDPFLYTILEHEGPSLTDLAVFGKEAITQRCILKLPNLRALRFYGPNYNVYEYIPNPICCKFLRVFECVGPHVIPAQVVEALVHYGYSTLRAVAVFSTVRGMLPGSIMIMEYMQELGA